MSEQHEQDDVVMEGFSPAGMVVLVVDDDKLCLKVIGKMLQQCNYEVRTCSGVSEALALLRDDSNHFDLVLSDVVMPDIDGFKLLEIIGLEMDIPVIMMSYDGDTHTVLKGVTHGAVDFLIKPVRMEELSNMWQHVVRKRARRSSEEPAPDTPGDHAKRAGSVSSGEPGGAAARAGGAEAGAAEAEQHAAAPDYAAAGVEHDSKKRTNEDKDASHPQSAKRPRVHWSSQMHSQFVAAVNKLGIDKAVPKKILELMTVEGLTRENVASHLQKYRLYLKKASKMDGAAPQPATSTSTPPVVAQPVNGTPQADPQYANYQAGAAGMVMPGVQHVPQPTVQMYAGMPAAYMSQPHWQQPMICAPMPGHSPYMQHMQPHYSSLMPGQPVAGALPVDPSQGFSGEAYGVAPAQAAVAVCAPSTLPPLQPDALGEEHMEGEFALKGSAGGLCHSFGGSGMDDGSMPEEIDSFLDILVRDAPLDK